MKRVFIFFFLISLTSFSQGKYDSIRKSYIQKRKRLKVDLDSIKKEIDAINKQIKIWKEEEAKTWSVDGRFTFLLNQSSYSNWVSGGENAVSGNILINYDFNYKEGKWKWDNKIISSYGLSYVNNQGFRKTDDRFEYNSVLAYNANKRWYFSFFSNFISQFSSGFDYSQNPNRLISTTLSPAYWSFGPGMFWRKNDNYRINIAPATSRFTFVSPTFSGQYGVEPGKTSAYGLGFNLSGYIKFDLAKNVTIENIVQIYSDYLDKPQNIDVNYQTNFLVNLNKLFTLNLTLHTIIDDKAASTEQFRQLFGFGFIYTFHKI